jgi:hypothetical protein
MLYNKNEDAIKNIDILKKTHVYSKTRTKHLRRRPIMTNTTQIQYNLRKYTHTIYKIEEAPI